MKDIKIYVMAHKAFEEPQNDIYIPLQVGAALHDSLGYVPDDSGDNISVKNPFYNELTGLYWMWKNQGKCDIMGLCHYRRFFLNENSEILTDREIEKILVNYDIIVTPRVCYPEGTSIYEQYADKHFAKELDLTRAAIEKLYPEYLKDYDGVVNGREMYFANMMIAKRELVCKYAQWLFTVLFDVEANLDMSDYNDYDKRVFGFIAERLVMVWVLHNNLRVCETMVGLMAEKSETIEVINKSADLLKQGNYKDALNYMNEMKNVRPDLFFMDSDTKGELAAIYTFAEIMLVEERAGKNNLCAYSTDFKELTKLYIELKDLVAECGRSGDLYGFIKENNLSVEFVTITIGKVLDEKEHRVMVYNYLANRCLDDKDINMARLYVGLALREGQ